MTKMTEITKTKTEMYCGEFVMKTWRETLEDTMREFAKERALELARNLHSWQQYYAKHPKLPPQDTDADEKGPA